ncbi:MAG: tetratricopeptide repeat protein [Lysobacteraceae bacterium]
MTASSFRVLPKTALNAAIALLIGCAFAGGALAQDSEAGDDLEEKPKSTTMTGSAAAAAERARQRKAEAKNKSSAEPVQYPQATRTEPAKQPVSGKDAKTANATQADYDAKKYADVMSKVDAFAAAGSTNTYLLSYLYQLAASAATSMDDNAKGAEYFKKTLDANGLNNNGHYQIMFNYAITLNQLDRYPEALATIDRFLSETRSEKPEAIALKAYLLSQLDRPAEGAAMYEKILAANPNDRSVLMNAVALYQQADNFDKANTLLENARKQGLLVDGKEYRALFVGYINAEKYREAQAVLEEGVAKGAIKPSQTLANDYSIIAQSYYADDKVPQTIDFYTRASKVATDGEASLNLAKVLRNEDRLGEAKAAAREALAKGVKKPKEANDILALPGKK